MERFQWLETKNKVCLVYLECKLQQDRRSQCNYKLKCLKTAEISYLQAKKEQNKVFRDLEVGTKVRLVFCRPKQPTKG